MAEFLNEWTVDIDGAADLLGLHKKTVLSFINVGEIPAAKIGRAYVMMRSDILNFMSAHPVKARRPNRGPDEPKTRYPEDRRRDCANRRAAKLFRTPKWACKKSMQQFYDTATYLTDLTGIDFQVDHVIPLQGTRISGLHVQTNLQVITKAQNSKKKNTFDLEAQS